MEKFMKMLVERHIVILLLPVIHDVAAGDDPHAGKQIILIARHAVST